MGLLGHILEARFTMHRVDSPWIWMESERVDNIDEFLAALGKAAPAWPMTMGWIDCLNTGSSMGRGILMAGRWATPRRGALQASPRGVARSPFPARSPELGAQPHDGEALQHGLLLEAHGQADGGPGSRRRRSSIRSMPILEWNRAYGPRGFTQYRCVIPRAAGAPAVREFMQLLTKLGGASPLCVIKDCGPGRDGHALVPARRHVDRDRHGRLGRHCSASSTASTSS